MSLVQKKQPPKKSLYDYINIILKDKNKNMDKAYELEKLFKAFKHTL